MNARGSNSRRQPGWDRLKVMEVPLAALRPFPKHARKHPAHQIRALARSIEAFGFNVPVVIDEENRLLSGHARFAAAERLGWTSVPAVQVSDLSEAEKRAFVLADNRLTEQGRWDDALLAENFRILEALGPDFALEDTGFSVPEIDHCLGLAILDGETGLEDEVPVLGGPPVCQPGDLWQLRDHRLFCGDALEIASHDAVMGQDRARMVLTDPPYNVRARHIGRVAAKRHGDFASGAGELDDAGFVGFLGTVFGHARHTMADGALAYVFMDWGHAWHALEAGRAVFDELKNICIWNKLSGGMGSFYRSQHEFVLIFKAGRAAHVNNLRLGSTGRNRSNVWDHPGANTGGGALEDAGRGAALALHPTIKPVRLLAEAILDATRPGDLVLDPFLGVGSTLMAAERTGRVCRGIELEPRYADAALRRWQAYTGEEPVHVATGLPYSEYAASLRDQPQPSAHTEAAS